MTTLVLAHGTLQPLTVKRIRALAGEGAQIVALDLAADLALRTAGIAHKTRAAYPSQDSSRRGVDWLNEWSCKSLLNGRNIKDVLVYEDFSFWWCMEHWLFYSFYYRDQLEKIIDAVDAVKTIINIEHPEQIAFVDEKTLFSKVIPRVAGSARMIPIVQRRPLRKRFWEFFRPSFIKQFLRWHTRARRLIWRWQRWRAGYTPESKGGQKVLIACAYQWKPVDHPALTRPILGDPYTTPIGEQFTNDTVTYIDCTQRFYMGFNALRQKARTKQRHVLLEQFLSGKAWQTIRKITRRLQLAARELERSPAFLASWNYEGIDLWPLIAPQFRSYFSHRLEGHVMDYVCVGSLLDREQPDIAVYPCESNDLAYVFFSQCAKRGIPCVALQHGSLPYAPPLVHLPEEACVGSPRCVPRPTRLLVHGPYYKEFVVKHTRLPPESIAVVGNLRYDHFAAARNLSKKTMAEKYGIDPSKQCIMFLTQILHSEQETEELARSIFAAAKDLSLPLIVKQHPAEPSDALYRRLANELGLKPIITKTAPTLELLTASDILIGPESTLDYEAMILDKPVIIVNFSSMPEGLPFVRENAALGVHTPEEVLPALKKSLFDAKTRSALLKNARAIVEAHCFKVDGKAAERAVDVMRGLMA